MQRLARQHHSARAPLLVLALVVAMGAAMCVRVHRALVVHPAAATARPAAAAGVANASASDARR